MNAKAGPSEPQTGIRVPPGWRSQERPSIEEKSSSSGPQPLALPPTTTCGEKGDCLNPLIAEPESHGICQWE